MKRFRPVIHLTAALIAAVPTGAQEIVELTGRDRHLEPAFEEVFRVGVLDGEPWEMFATVPKIAFDAQGNLYVFDRAPGVHNADLRIVIFDRSGAFVREFGSEGEGPGEFREPGNFAVLRDGTIVVGDTGHRAYQLFDPSGEFVRMVRMGEVTTSRRTGNVMVTTTVVPFIRPDPLGPAVFALGAPESADGTGQEESVPDFRTIVHHRLEGEEVETRTVARAWHPPRGDAESSLKVLGPDDVVNALSRLREIASAVSGPRLFEPTVRMAVLPDGAIIYADSSTYKLKITGPGGGPVGEDDYAAVPPGAGDGADRGGVSEKAGREELGVKPPRGYDQPGDPIGVLLPRTTRHPQGAHHMGRPDMGHAPGRRILRGRPPRRADRRWRLHRHLPRRGHEDARRIRPRRTGGLHRTG